MARKMSAAARRAISEAAKKRWAKYRVAKASGAPVATRRPGRPAGSKRRGRPARAAASGLVFAGHTTNDLVVMRRRIDQELADRLVREIIAN